MVWLIAVACVLAALWVVVKLFHSTLYLCHPSGFVSLSFSSPGQLSQVSRSRYERVLQRFLAGDLFDVLELSHTPEARLVLELHTTYIEMGVSCLPLKERELLDHLRESMAEQGYEATAERPGNVGMGEDLETLWLEYRLPRDSTSLMNTVAIALAALEPSTSNDPFVGLFRSKDVPDGVGIKIVPRRDLLSQIP